jgi:hypothetical protein
MIHSWNTINLVHVLATGPLLIYIGLSKNISPFFYNLLIAISILIVLYLVYLLLQINERKRTWLIIHLLVFLPLLLWCGIAKEKTPYMIKSALLAIGCGAFGYHLIYIIKRLIS